MDEQNNVETIDIIKNKIITSNENMQNLNDKYSDETKIGYIMSMISNLYSIPLHTMFIFFLPAIIADASHDESAIGWLLIFFFPVAIGIVIAQITSVILSFIAVKIYIKNKKEIKDVNRIVMNYLNILNIIITFYFIIKVIT